jgi:Tfp pilus assembly protein FimT
MSTIPAERRRKGARGATVLEMIILIVLLIILAAIGIPGISPVVQQLRLRGAAWQVAGDLRLARQRAITLKQGFRICVSPTPSVPGSQCLADTPTASYSFDRNTGTGWFNNTGAVSRLPQDVTVSASATPVFSETGVASPTATFTLRNLIGLYEVRVSITGRVLVCQGGCS